MVSVSHESESQTDARLLRVITQARLDVYEGSYAFREFSLCDFPAAVHKNALALVRDKQVWSQLVPYVGDDSELFRVFCFHFPTGIDNSGFIGWLANRIKRRFGAGLLVTCGSNQKDGGIFDYWGIPLSVAQEVLNEIRTLHAGQPGARNELHARMFSLTGVSMRMVSSDGTGVVSSDTILVFEQTGNTFSARYRGGPIIDGYLIGKLKDDGLLEFRYVQTDVSGNLDAGASTGFLSRSDNGRLRLTERFQWATREESGENIFEEFNPA